MIEAVDRERYLRYDPFAGDKDNGGARLSSVKIVKTRIKHTCQFDGNTHMIPIGTLAQYHKAIIDDAWGSFYVCCMCIDKWYEEWGMGE